MKTQIIIIMTLCMVHDGSAQDQPMRIKENARSKRSDRPPSLKMTISQIDSQLNKIVERHIGEPNVEATWIKIRREAEDLLLAYFQSGKLIGSKPAQAYFIKMGNETMTTSDLANRKMILHAGVAAIKPGEFEIIRVEKMCIAK